MNEPMQALYSVAYIDQLICSRTYDSLVMLSTYVEAASAAPGEPRRGLQVQLFVFVEALAWFAQSDRSGAWSYFEATSSLRQEAMRASLVALGFDSLAQQYSFGMRHWEDAVLMQQLDRWLEENEEQNESWLFGLVISQHDQLKCILCRE